MFYIHTHTHTHLFQNARTCNDDMDQTCLRRCIDNNADCLMCEPTRPILLLPSPTQGGDVNSYLEDSANSMLTGIYIHLTLHQEHPNPLSSYYYPHTLVQGVKKSVLSVCLSVCLLLSRKLLDRQI